MQENAEAPLGFFVSVCGGFLLSQIGEKMKLRRSERMVVISNYLINHPYELTSLNTFAEKYESAKSSISEDIVIIKRAFEEIEIGTIETEVEIGRASCRERV